MGRSLFTEFLASRMIFEEADHALGFKLTNLMFQGEESELRKSSNAQCAILTHSMAALAAARVGGFVGCFFLHN
jgi:[acyl-carrier-protein] S-malonyltransferase